MSWRSNPNPCVKPPFGSYIDWSHPLANGLVGCWIFNESQGLTLSELANNKHGTIIGPTWVENGLDFKGSPDYVDLPDVPIYRVKTNFSIFTSFKNAVTIDSSISSDIATVNYGNGSSGNWAIFWYHNDSGRLRLPGTYGGNIQTARDIWPANQIFNIGFTYKNSSDIKGYVNGNVDVSGTADSIDGSSYIFNLGRLSTASTSYFNGNICYLFFWSRILLATEAEWLHAEPYCFITWPSHRVIFDYGAGSTYTLSADAGAYTLSGTTADVLLNRLLSAETGTYALTGQEANLLLGYLLNAESGSYTLNGQTANLLLNRLLATESGSLTLTGQNTSLLLNRLLSTESGSFTLSGVNVNLLLGRVLGAEAGSFTLIGTDVNLVYSGSATYTLTADVGTFTLTGTNASLLVNRILTVDNGSFALSGQDASLLLNRLLAAGTGSFTLTGQDVSLLVNRILNTETGELILSGQDVSLLLNRLLSTQTGLLTLAGQNITLLANRKLNAESGLYSLVGTDVVFTWSGQPIAHGKLTITFTPRKSGFTFTPRKPGITLS